MTTVKTEAEFNEALKLIETTVKNEVLKKSIQEAFPIARKLAPLCSGVYKFTPTELKLPPMLTINRYHETDCLPDFSEFWEHPDALEELYLALQREGYYTTTQGGNNGSS